jgi:hypothetical protein
MSNYLIFGTTSRGANLHGFIQKQNPFPQIINPQVVVKRGRSINQIDNDIRPIYFIYKFLISRSGLILVNIYTYVHLAIWSIHQTTFTY